MCQAVFFELRDLQEEFLATMATKAKAEAKEEEVSHICPRQTGRAGVRSIA